MAEAPQQETAAQDTASPRIGQLLGGGVLPPVPLWRRPPPVVRLVSTDCRLRKMDQGRTRSDELPPRRALLRRAVELPELVVPTGTGALCPRYHSRPDYQTAPAERRPGSNPSLGGRGRRASGIGLCLGYSGGLPYRRCPESMLPFRSQRLAIGSHRLVDAAEPPVREKRWCWHRSSR